MLEVGALVSSVDDAAQVLGPIQSIRKNTALVWLYSAEAAASYELNELMPVTLHFTAKGWGNSSDKACNVRKAPDMESRKIGTRKDGDEERVSHDVDGFLKLSTGGWVRKKGNFCGEWVLTNNLVANTPIQDDIVPPKPKQEIAEVTIDTNERPRPATPVAPAPTPTHDQEVAEMAAIMRQAFLNGTSVDDALNKALGRVQDPQPCEGAAGDAMDRSSGGNSPANTKSEISLGEPEVVRSTEASPRAADEAAGESVHTQSVDPSPKGRVRICEVGEEETGGTPVWQQREERGERPGIGYAKQKQGRKRSTSRGRKKKTAARVFPVPRGVAPPATPPPPPLDPALTAWLKQHKLLPFAAVFARHEVDFDVLPTLTYSDFVEMQLSPHICHAISHAIKHPDRPRQRSPARKHSN